MLPMLTYSGPLPDYYEWLRDYLVRRWQELQGRVLCSSDPVQEWTHIEAATRWCDECYAGACPEHALQHRPGCSLGSAA